MKRGRILAIEPGPPAMAALIVDGRLDDLLIDGPAEAGPSPEEIWRLRVRKVLPRQGGALLKLPGGGEGWLREAPEAREGELVLAEATGRAEPGKAVDFTGRRLHRGRLAILTPLAAGVNVARGLRDREERARLEAAGRAALGDAPESAGWGLILRTAAEGASEAELAAEVAALTARERAAAAGGPPGRVAPGPDAAARARRDWAADETEAEAGVFDRLGLWEAIEALRSPRAELGGGAWMAVEPTSALVAVDVNTGGDLSGEAAAAANLAAAAELPRQLRLRGLGGRVAVDFAPLRKTDRRAVEAALTRALGEDPIRTEIAGWTPLGMLELQRKRERRPTAALIPDA